MTEKVINDKSSKYETNLYKERNAKCRKCHDLAEIYCNYCYCPYYFIANCKGNYIILGNGVKDCSKCTIPHTKEFVDKHIIDDFNY